jgi:hypothetical protein
VKSFYWEEPSRESALNAVRLDGYPVQDDIQSGESGQGYALRMASANFLTGLGEIRRRLGKNTTTTLSSSDASFLAQWFGADATKLQHALEETDLTDLDEFFDGVNQSVYAGHLIPRQNYLNRMAPRVCPECLQEQDACRIEWDFAFVTACPRHERLLIDRCPGCLSSITWQRPAVNICDCGAYLTEASQCVQKEPTLVDLEVSRWISEWVGSESTPGTKRVNGSALMKLLSPLSLHGGMNILWALSLAEDSNAHKNKSVADGHMLDRCCKTLIKANEFCIKLTQSDLETFRSKKRHTLIPILARCMHESYTYEDRSLVQSLISTILRSNKRLAKTIGHFHLQDMLFLD